MRVIFFTAEALHLCITNKVQEMKTDKSIQCQIEKALETCHALEGAKIDVTVMNGAATLTGYADKFFKKEIARKIAKEVEGVTLVAEAIVIVLDEADKISDIDIKAIITERFKKNFSAAYKEINIRVRDGYVGLKGQLKWNYQKQLAEECISDVEGIKGIENTIFIPATLQTGIDEKHVLAAIYSDPSIKSDIKVEVIGHRIILKGNVENTNQKNLVTRLVRNVEGVKEIENFLNVVPKR